MRCRLLPVLAVLLLTTSSVGADERVTVRTIRQSFAVTDIDALRLELPVGEARIIGEHRDDIELVVALRCRPEKERCADRAREVTLESSTRGRRLAVELRGFDDGSRGGMIFDGTIRVPAALALGVDMGVGELGIERLEGDVTAELGVGEMTLRLPPALRRHTQRRALGRNRRDDAPPPRRPGTPRQTLSPGGQRDRVAAGSGRRRPRGRGRRRRDHREPGMTPELLPPDEPLYPCSPPVNCTSPV